MLLLYLLFQVAFHNRNYKHLQHEVYQAQQRVYEARAGYVRKRPVSAPDLQLHSLDIPKDSGVNTSQSRPQTVMDIAGHIITPKFQAGNTS